MKITPKQYAILLYELTKDVKDKEADQLIKQFLNLLIKNRNLALLPKIQRLYQDYYNQQEKVVDVEIVTATEVPKKLFAAVQENLRGQNCQMNLKVDQTVLGGASIRAGDYQVDDTLKARLINLKQSLK